MNAGSRMNKSIKNVSFAMAGYFVSVILQLINRLMFVRFLSAEYLGVNGLFTNIISLLAISELGIGTAIVFALYKPVAHKDTEKIKSLMALYKRLYAIIGWCILVVGTLLTPFLQFLIKEMPDIRFLRVYYILYVLNAGISYFFTYKKSLIICNQEEYISTSVTMAVSVCTKVSQILILCLTKSFLLYLILQVVFTGAENIVIARIADKKYPYLKDRDVKPLEKSETDNIRKNVFAMMLHKVGEAVLNATDNLIVSKIMGLIPVGLLSNYTILFDMVGTLVTRIFAAITPSLGNVAAVEDKKKTEEVFNRVFFVNYWLIGFCTICLFCLSQPFVRLWLGEDYMLEDSLVLVLAGCFYIQGMRRTVLQFRTALGLFWNDRYKAILESVMNLGISIPLTMYLGLVGVKLGTLLSMLLTSFWIEGYILFRQYFKKSPKGYLFKQACCAALTLLLGAGTQYACRLIPSQSVLAFLMKCVICVTVPNACCFLIFFKTREFGYFRELAAGFLRKKR